MNKNYVEFRCQFVASSMHSHLMVQKKGVTCIPSPEIFQLSRKNKNRVKVFWKLLEISAIMQAQDWLQQKEWPSAIWKSVVLKVAGTKRSVVPGRAYFSVNSFCQKRCAITSERRTYLISLSV